MRDFRERLQFELKKYKRNKVCNYSIREIVQLITNIEMSLGEVFIRLDMGIPSLQAEEVGIKAEEKALQSGKGSLYPPIQGIPMLKEQMSRFLKLFLNIDIAPGGCIPTVGSIQASFLVFMLTSKIFEKRTKTLFIDPGFPVHKLQHKVLNIEYESVDVFNFREKSLLDTIECSLKTRQFSCIFFSNPNNPTWLCLSNSELKGIAELAAKYNLLVIEDMAYFGMDTRIDSLKPGKEPYVPSISQYYDKYILLFSSSKLFSYAGQRIATCCISDKLFHEENITLTKHFMQDTFGSSLIFGPLYAMCAGVAHSCQFALAEMLKAANDENIDLHRVASHYASVANKAKQIFLKNGFQIEYNNDSQSLADGFYFTVFYPYLNGDDLFIELLSLGISTVLLKHTGSKNETGVRICVSQLDEKDIIQLDVRLNFFNKIHSQIHTSEQLESS